VITPVVRGPLWPSPTPCLHKIAKVDMLDKSIIVNMKASIIKLH
jgi:hypothetical protein